MSEKHCTKQIRIYNFTNFCLTLDQLSPNVNLCHSHLGKGFVTMQVSVPIPTGVLIPLTWVWPVHSPHIILKSLLSCEKQYTQPSIVLNKVFHFLIELYSDLGK